MGKSKQEEKRTHKLDDKTMDIIVSEEQKEKQLKKSEQCLRDLWDTRRWTRIGTVAVPEGEKREKQAERIFEKLQAGTFKIW